MDALERSLGTTVTSACTAQPDGGLGPEEEEGRRLRPRAPRRAWARQAAGARRYAAPG
ncbi:Hypothetical predicted protein [Lynx pardinus]|uniref:Uncharacterized protein n=1 Tax=Lynx pardinus TaxID=191816 RepID=A0A485NAS6_LYNPA|nr:Hypothetical predicted protein [Lynx pardinus]